MDILTISAIELKLILAEFIAIAVAILNMP